MIGRYPPCVVCGADALVTADDGMDLCIRHLPEPTAVRAEGVSMAEPNWADVDPRMRTLVEALRYNGFETTDSGFGDSDMECAMPWPHVAMVVPPVALVEEACRLRDVLADLGVDVVPLREDMLGASIQAGYCPALDMATLLLTGVTGADLGDE